ncbi:hypothetical protein GCM10010246_21680 [Streptomyces cuspidosporus]|uniref:Uncharacterized protein n=1 Tax=Streptomyces cuspidosporus TaxID=66882 RepID=A0ABN3FT86_9ACTN
MSAVEEGAAPAGAANPMTDSAPAATATRSIRSLLTNGMAARFRVGEVEAGGTPPWRGGTGACPPAPVGRRRSPKRCRRPPGIAAAVCRPPPGEFHDGPEGEGAHTGSHTRIAPASRFAHA